MAELKKVKATDRGVVVENPLPYSPENIHLSKVDFVAKDKARKEKELKIKEFAKSLDKEEENKPSIEDKPKPKGRPKVIK